jgi:DnaK suppressor protein
MLTQEDIQKFKKGLEDEQAKLIAELNGLKKPEKIDMGDDIDHGDEEADEAEETAITTGVNKNLKGRLENIKMALFRIEQNHYGFCEKCGAEIEKEILEIDPESRWCKTCKIEVK